MLQLEINLCFFAFYELVPEWEGDIPTQWAWGGAETIAIREVSISRLGNNMVHNFDCDLPAFLLATGCEHLPLIGHSGSDSRYGALQTMNNPLCTPVHRSPHTRLSPFHQFLELFVVLIVNTEHGTMFVLLATTALSFSSL